jgi:hypothetical protein
MRLLIIAMLLLAAASHAQRGDGPVTICINPNTGETTAPWDGACPYGWRKAVL